MGKRWECWDLEYDEDEVYDAGNRRKWNCMPSYTLVKAFQGDKNLRA